MNSIQAGQNVLPPLNLSTIKLILVTFKRMGYVYISLILVTQRPFLTLFLFLPPPYGQLFDIKSAQNYAT